MEAIHIEEWGCPEKLDENGDTLFPCCNKWYNAVHKDWNDHETLSITTLAVNPWKFLQLAKVLNNFDNTKYKCVWSDNVYYGFWPIILVCDNLSADEWVSRAFDGGLMVNEPFVNMAKDSSWTRKWINEYADAEGGLIPIGSIGRAFMGHGYTHVTMPDSGTAEYRNAAMLLSNGDRLIGRTWIWYNK